jgi:hypothetical protein
VGGGTVGARLGRTRCALSAPAPSFASPIVASSIRTSGVTPVAAGAVVSAWGFTGASTRPLSIVDSRRVYSRSIRANFSSTSAILRSFSSGGFIRVELACGRFRVVTSLSDVSADPGRLSRQPSQTWLSPRSRLSRDMQDKWNPWVHFTHVTTLSFGFSPWHLIHSIGDQINLWFSRLILNTQQTRY